MLRQETNFWEKFQSTEFKAVRIKDKKEKNIIAQFQEPNSNVRLLIGSIKSDNMGISLHDTTGEFPRVIFSMPSYAAIDQHQLAGRTYRRGLKGVTDVRFVYGDSLDTELKLVERLKKKGSIMQEIADPKQKLKFASNYETFYEKDIMDSDKYRQWFQTKSFPTKPSKFSFVF